MLENMTIVKCTQSDPIREVTVALIPHEVELVGIGAKTPNGDRMAATLQIALMDTETKLFSHISVGTFVPRTPEMTLKKIREEVRANALALLEKAFGMLKANDMAKLEADSKGQLEENIKVVTSDQ